MQPCCEPQDKAAGTEQIKSLQTHLEHTSIQTLTELILLATLAAYCCSQQSNDSPSAGDILTALLQIHINGLAVVPQRHSYVRDRIALAVYPTASLMNHSCQPNVALAFNGAELTARAVEPLQVRQAVLHCYGPQKGAVVTPLRQQQLHEQYHFLCQCQACTKGFNNAEQAMVGLRCLDKSCDGAVVPMQPVPAGICSIYDLPENVGNGQCNRCCNLGRVIFVC